MSAAPRVKTAGQKGAPRKAGGRLATRFAMTMIVALLPVLLVAGFVLYQRTAGLAQQVQDKAFVEAAAIQGPRLELLHESYRLEKLGLPPPVASVQVASKPGGQSTTHAAGRLRSYEGTLVSGSGRELTNQEVLVYEWRDATGSPVLPPLAVPAALKDQATEGLPLTIALAILAILIVSAIVAFTVGSAVARPVEVLVDDVGKIARGNLGHRTRVQGGGEVARLAAAVDRMASELKGAQEAQEELAARERELALAGDVREQFLPTQAPQVPGYTLAAKHLDSPSPGGDFHDFIVLPNGRLGILVADVSGRGIPGAMIGAIARSYLRVELARGDDPVAAFVRANREIARDVRRGMYISALYVLLDPRAGVATVVCAGHKLPLVRLQSGDGQVRTVQPEGIALGLDKGPVFERSLTSVETPVNPGDRLVLANTGPVAVINRDSAEFGEKAYYRALLASAKLDSPAMLSHLVKSLEAHAQGVAFPQDVSLVVLSRDNA